MNLIRPPRGVIVVGSFLSLWPVPAIAAPDFGYVYTAEVDEPGESEISLWATERGGKDQGHYDAEDYKIEFERGISRRFQLSGYAMFTGHHVRSSSGGSDRIERDFAFQGFSGELQYQLRSPNNGRLGLAVYAEPEWSRISKLSGERTDELAVELKAIVQKNFMAGRVVWAANLTLEPEWEKPHEGTIAARAGRQREKELAAEISTGLAYHFARNWWIGAEGRYHSIYPDWTHGLHRENYAVYAGPMVQFDGGKWAATVSWLPQLTGAPAQANSSLELHDHEKSELRLKLAFEL